MRSVGLKGNENPAVFERIQPRMAMFLDLTGFQWTNLKPYEPFEAMGVHQTCLLQDNNNVILEINGSPGWLKTISGHE